jgi:hypothetical protein
MPMKKYKPEQIVTPLRQVEVELANGKTTPQACKEAEITAQTYYPLAEGIRRMKTRSSQTSQGAGAGERQAEAARRRAGRNSFAMGTACRVLTTAKAAEPARRWPDWSAFKTARSRWRRSRYRAVRESLAVGVWAEGRRGLRRWLQNTFRRGTDTQRYAPRGDKTPGRPDVCTGG